MSPGSIDFCNAAPELGSITVNTPEQNGDGTWASEPTPAQLRKVVAGATPSRRITLNCIA